jgi:hypothetical protein
MSGDVFGFVGPGSNWGVAANWGDDTTGATATRAPGAGDTVHIGVPIVTGVGDALAMTLLGSVLLSGDITVGNLTVDQDFGFVGVTTGGEPPPSPPVISIDAGHTLKVIGDAAPPPRPVFGVTDYQPGTDASNFAVSGAGARFLVGGMLTVNIGGLTATDGGAAQVGVLALDGALALDSTSSVEVGFAGAAAQGALTIDAGAVLSANSYTIQLSDAQLVNNGTLALLQGLGGVHSSFVSADTIINRGTVIAGGSYPQTITAASIVNDGEIVAAGGVAGDALSDLFLVVQGSIIGVGRIEDGGGGIALDRVGSGQTIHLVGGSHGTALSLSPNSLDDSGAFEATIANFTVHDAIFFTGTVTSAVWSWGVLTLTNGQATVAKLHLAGDYGGAAFTSIADGSGATEIEVGGLAPTVAHDFTGGGLSDFLIENASGAVVVGSDQGGQASYVQVTALGPEWQFEGTGDFLGTSTAQFLIENTAGEVFVGKDLSGSTSYVAIGALGPEWRFEGTGDFLGDGSTGFLIENTVGAVVVGEVINGRAMFTQVASLGHEWSFEGAGDFLGDGKSDFLIENTSGAVAVGEAVRGAASYTDVAGLGPEWRFVETGDFLAHGRADFLIENATGAVVAGEVTNGNAGYTQIAALGPEWKFVGAGDYLGEGHDQFLVESTAGAVVMGDWNAGQIHYSDVTALGAEWAFH